MVTQGSENKISKASVYYGFTGFRVLIFRAGLQEKEIKIFKKKFCLLAIQILGNVIKFQRASSRGSEESAVNIELLKQGHSYMRK